MTWIVTHIPKTAGTTLRIFLWEHVEETRRIAIGDDIAGEMAYLYRNPTEVAYLKVLFGHICYGWHEALQIRDPKYITILREPVERVRSLFDFCSKHPGHYMYSKTKYMSFREFMSSGVTQTIDNAMVRQLCGADRFLREPDRDMIIPFGGVTQEHLEMAKANLQNYWLVGIAGYYQLFQDELCAALGWPYKTQKFANRRSSRNRTNVEKDRAWAKERLALDYELYEFAKRLVL